MTFGVEMITQIVEKIVNQELRYEDTILIGDNSSGKSELLRRLISALGLSPEVYFIDAVNRSFSVKDVSRTRTVPAYTDWILKTRLDSEHFNLEDSFNCYGTRTERIEMIYLLFEKKLQTLFCELTGTVFQLLPDRVAGEVKFPEGVGILSSGYQALARILLELLYFERVRKEEPARKAWVIIDELDEFLSPRYAGKIWAFLKKNFPEYRFVVTTHSSDLVANAADANLITLTEPDYGIWDVNDYDSSSSVQMIFDRLFGLPEDVEDDTFSLLQNLLGRKMNGAWSDADESRLRALDKKQLTASQTLIYRQIMKW